MLLVGNGFVRMVVLVSMVKREYCCVLLYDCMID